MIQLMDPTAAAFMTAESRNQLMHVGGLQLFRKPEGAGRAYVRELFDSLLDVDEVAPLFLKRPHRSLTTGGQWAWTEDDQFDIEHHVRHSALPRPGRIRELLALASRLHGTPLARERPLWEAHLIEGLRDGRVAMYTKMHHSLVDGVSALRLLQSVLTTNPDQRDMPPPWAVRPRPPRLKRVDPDGDGHGLLEAPLSAVRSALGVTAEAAGMPSAIVRTLTRGLRNEASAFSFYAPRSILNVNITAARRFAAQDWPIERIRAVGKSTGTTINDVVLAMCGGALRAYLLEQDALPDSGLVAMVPVGLRAREAQTASESGGNALGAVMVRLGTELADPAERLRLIHRCMKDGKDALGSMTPAQIIAISGIGMAPSILMPMLRLQGITRPPFNLVISNVPGPRTAMYLNGAMLEGMYPLSIPFNGMALNITCTSYNGVMGFGLTGCRRSLPHLQRLLIHLDDELAGLEKAAAVP